MPGQEAEQGEQVGLLAVRGQSTLLAGGQRERVEAGGEAGHERRVARAAAGGDHLGDAVGAAGVGDGGGGQLGQRGEKVGSAMRAGP